MRQGFKHSAFHSTYLLPTPSWLRVFLPLATGWSRHCSSCTSRTIVWRSSPSSAWPPFRLLSIVALLAYWQGHGGSWPMSSDFSVISVSFFFFTCFLLGT